MKTQLSITGNGTPVLLVGTGLTGSLSWAPHAEKLASTRRVVLAQPLSVEFAVRRASLPADYSIEMESHALRSALDHLGLEQPIDLVGWSFGGLIALDFALDSPQRVRSLVLVEPDAAWALPDYGRADPEVRKTEDYALRWADGVSEDDLAVYMGEMLGPGQSAREHPRWRVWNLHREALRAAAAIFRHRDDVERLRGFSRPVLLIEGEGTERYNVAITAALAAALPDVRVARLPGGHLAPVAALDQFLEQMAAFQAAVGR